ncbi:2Fe-2S iron-sulfur cluster-binding protein [Amycolatopsis sp. NPDC051045]|uniref:2Fe-2S iron-sulfur cluster-binding protein n=1 Tax=Amycolatopsis sp. NPDC051045 TaxID=3156922 RepID=UPI00341A57AE
MTRLSGVPLKFTFDGRELTGYLGDTLASALLANGIHQVATSIKYGRPRGIVAAGVEDSNALVQIDAPFPEPMLSATTVELYDGLEARGLRGRGRLATEPDPARYDAKHAHCDVLVIGAGPAGLAAARAASGRVLLVDDQPDGEAPEGVRFLSRTTAFGIYDDGFVLALERRGEPVAPERLSRQRIRRIRAKRIVIATGAHERPIVFPDNDRPGIMLAGAARTYLNRYGVLAGSRVVVFTTNDSALDAASELAGAGAEIVRIVDAREGYGVIGTDGGADGHITAAHIARLGEMQGERVECDLLLVSGGWNPAVHLFSQARGKLRYAPELGAYVPDGDLPTVSVVGAAAGEGLPETKVLWQVPAPKSEVDTRFVDQQRDATVSDVLRATGAGLRSLEHIKRYTTIGTAHDQGKTSGMLAAGITAEALGADLATQRPTTFRPPYTPVAFAALAGRHRGDLHDPVRVTTIHPWHVEHGAEFENVGQWKRPRYYPRPGETMHDAVLRECRAARNGVALMDGSTLGKIDVQGPDAGWFLDMLYTNMMSNLKVGRIRYGVMCGVDGMVLDDGTVIRVAEDRFLVTTTTGNAAKVLDWMEEWLQTEWPHLSVFATSVTEHWATIPLVGPKSREVLGRLAPGLDVSNDAFGFMTWQDAEVAGIPARVCRISFSGELAYEINVRSWHGIALWQSIVAEGATPYGTETMHVLRAEKGYPIIGQDTDGTVTPQDLGMSWVVSKKKADFLGKRSFARAENNRPDRKQLVGLLPVDPSVLLPEGSQLIESEVVPEPPVRMLGHVTSSYHSAALGRTFALALVRSGRERIGETLYVPAGDRVVPVTVTGSVLFDEEGARRDG